MEIKKLLKTLLEEAEFYEEEASDHGTAIACRAAIAAVAALLARVVELDPLVVDGVRRSDNCQNWQARADDYEASMGSLFEAIRHGDAEHETWLRQAITDHFAGRPVERPRGMGNQERAEATEARGVELAGALAHLLEFADSTGQGCAKQVENARAVLASTPAEALARAKGEDYAAGLEAAAKWHDDLVTFMEDGPPADSTEAIAKLHQKCAKAIRALGKEKKKDA